MLISPMARRYVSTLSAVLLTICSMLSSWALAADSDYRLGPGDLLRIGVFGSPELSGEVRVSESGNITYPLIGQVPVAGKSPAQVEAQLVSAFTDGGYLKQAQVSVLVMEYRSQKVSVMGHVTKPGQYSLQSSSRVLDVLAEAGGPVNSEAADVATLMRKDGSKAAIDLSALFGGDPTQNHVVGGGDTVYVPKAPQFYVYGEVQKPGMYKLERGMTVSRAISAGGGLTTRGSERRVVIKRKDKDGKEQHYSAKGSDLLQADDVLMVKEGLF
ncbi:polysaccharide export protein EpsE [Steroidobacter sp.]|uniref:polysaccharide export protein EpsE n=1 Tax=Steroidobacter sp. TaxID=1978227 RepID=UPI001A3E5796|nr:polysaccharide export protein EpsE [Steroidobacter sp.]MBL8267467.1 polysaccharide export protein EpsE [Steroidobacter sp.]